ncbi:MAG: hypothetical protein HPY66_2672 [Firmicutes bacterium]|nr:hypothetical protein [Bacillota bacterium]MDI6706588.1 sodium:solute symporter family protein [Bacillota bacterium]
MTYLLFFIIYSILIIVFGKYAFDKIEDSKSFYIANGTLGLFIGVCTFVATWFSATSVIALSGSIFVYGVSSMTYSLLGWFVGAFLLISLVPILRRYQIRTIPEFFRIHYYSKDLQATCAAVIIITHILYVVIQIRGFGVVVSGMLDIPYTMSIFLVYLFILYTTFGGLYSVARTDALNFFLILIGILMAVYLIIDRFGSLGEIFRQAYYINTTALPHLDYKNTEGSLLNPFIHGNYPFFFMLSAFIGWALGKASNPQYAIRIVAAKDNKTARNMILVSILIFLILYAGLFIISIGGRVLLPVVPVDSIDDVFPYIIQSVFGSKPGGFVMISVLAAVISTANSQLLLIGSSFSYDIYKNIINPQVKEEKLLSINRWAILIGGTVALFFSFTPPGAMLLYGSYVWGVIASVFFVPLYGAVLWPKGNRFGAQVGVYGGLLTCIILYGLNLLLFSGKDLIHSAIPGVLVATTLYIFFSLIKKQGEKYENEGF